MKLNELTIAKLVSLNPDRVEHKNLMDMVNAYGEYRAFVGANELIEPKTFSQWLMTEI